MKNQLKLSTPYKDGFLNVAFNLPKEQLTVDEATELSVIIEAFILDKLHKNQQYIAVFGNKPIGCFYVHFDKEASCEKSCMPPKVPAQIQDL